MRMMGTLLLSGTRWCLLIYRIRDMIVMGKQSEDSLPNTNYFISDHAICMVCMFVYDKYM